MAGGVAGGELGNSEAGSDYWTTCQYTPRYAPVIINGIEYATWYTTTTSSSNGVIAINLYTGQTEWVINTQDPLVFGMQVNWENPNQYGVCGPYIFTSGAYPGVVNVGTEYNMYDATTGNYLCSIVNGTAASYYAEDNQGDIVGYLINNTVGTQMVHPEPGVNVPVTNNGSSLEMWNLTNALGESGSALRDWGISVGQVFPWSNGLEYEVQSVPTTFNGASLVTMGLFGPAGLGQGLLEPYEISGNTLVLTGGTTSVGEVPGWQVEAGFNLNTGALMWIYNRTGLAYEPYTRIANTPTAGDGVYVTLNYANLDMVAYSLDTGAQVWTNSLDVQMADGNMPNAYDDFGLNAVVDQTYGAMYVWGFGGDVWAVNMTTGNIMWDWSTGQLSNAAANTPYGICATMGFHCRMCWRRRAVYR